jgi:hypothetical protein
MHTDRIKASLQHLIISTMIAMVCALIVFFIWYPTPYATALSVSEVVLLMLSIDVCLGPLLTFIVFNKAKTTLKFDITVIALVQSTALLYGMYTIGLGRPVYLAYDTKTLTVVTANEVYEAISINKKIELTNLNPWTQPLLGPKWVFAKNSSDQKLSNELAFTSFGGGPSEANLPALYEPFAAALRSMQTNAKTLSNLSPKAPSAQAQIAALRQRYPADSLIAPVLVKNHISLLAIFNPASGAVLGIEPVDVF